MNQMIKKLKKRRKKKKNKNLINFFIEYILFNKKYATKYYLKTKYTIVKMDVSSNNISNEVLQLINNDPYNYAKSISVNELAHIIKQLNILYYDTNTNVVSDEIYDILVHILYEREPHIYNDVIKMKVDNKNEKINYYITSMNKIKPDTNELTKWIKNYVGPYTISDKLDGISGVLIKKNNIIKLYKGRVSGSRNIAKNISYLLDTIKIDGKKIPNDVVIRGEFIINKHNFIKIKNNYANERSAVTSVINSNINNKEISELIEFVTYSIIYPEMKHHDQLKKLEEWGLTVVNYDLHSKISNEILSNHMLSRRKNSEYVIDGIIVNDSSKSYENSEENPKYAFAFKMLLTDQIAESIILKVIWKVTKDNYIIPKVKFEKVILGNTTIQYATCNHAKYIFDNNIGPGTIIQVVKNNDIIPGILGVLKSTKTQIPTIPYEWTKTGVDIMAINDNDESKIKKNMYFFKTLKIKNISEGIITKLYNNGYITIYDILNANKKEIYDIDGFGSTIIDKIYENIYIILKNTELYILMAASGCFGRHFGVKKLKLIVDMYPNILDTYDDIYDKIINIDGIGEVLATQFIDNLRKFIIFFEEINNVVDISYLKNKKTKITGTLFLNKKIVFTGFRNTKYEEFIVNNGGIIMNNISSNIFLVIYKNANTQKIKDAIKLNVSIISEDEFSKKYFYELKI